MAFETAKTRTTKIAELDGEAVARQLPRPLAGNDFRGMRAAFESKFWELDDARVPSAGFLERKLDQIEKLDLKAEKLSEVTTVGEDDGTDVLQTVWDPRAALTAVKKTSKPPLPSNPEQLRFRITLLGAGWMFTAFQQTNQKFLMGLTPPVVPRLP